jgi:hypothetical protein
VIAAAFAAPQDYPKSEYKPEYKAAEYKPSYKAADVSLNVPAIRYSNKNKRPFKLIIIKLINSKRILSLFKNFKEIELLDQRSRIKIYRLVFISKYIYEK